MGARQTSLFICGDLLNQADALGLFRGDALSGHAQAQRLGQADQGGQLRAAACTRQDAQAGLRQAKEGLGRGDSVVTGDAVLGAPAQGDAGDHADVEERKRPEGGQGRPLAAHVGLDLLRAPVGPFGHVGAGHKNRRSTRALSIRPGNQRAHI